ncbi:beta-ketoacyl synthase N-terminal-like domain-containing protein [Streptomyces sp. NPDC013455]|uniref:beta-ketoacyl synthase N-terminal-like domain-containing protein n=1 Tax=Streptomyces sp. NPDC013455 TaxID=3155605 RepID=UPI0034054280
MSTPVAVTGIGLASALGAGLDATWEALLAGRTARTTAVPAAGLYPGPRPAAAAALEDDLSDVPAFARRRLRALSRESLLVSRAGLLAWRDAGLDAARTAGGGPAPEEVGVVLGTAGAGLTGYLQVLHDGLTLGVDLVSPYAGPQGSLNAAVSDLAIAADAQGPVVTVTAGRCSGAEALTAAADLLRTGQAEVVLAAVVDVLDPLTLDAGAGRDADAPGPFAAGRTGALPGEAVVVLVLEDAGRARARGARVHAEVAAVRTGLGDPDDTDGRAAVRAVDAVLAEAGLGPGDIGLLSSSAAGCELVDRAEAHALHTVFGADTPVFAAGGALGDCAGATTLLQLALTARALDTDLTPPTPGAADRDPALPRLAVTAAPERRPGTTAALVLTTDRRPAAAAVLLRRPDTRAAAAGN